MGTYPHTTKNPTNRDPDQTLQDAFNEVDDSFTVNGFLVGNVGHRITMTVTTTNVASDTEVYNFFDGTLALYEITVVYTDGTRSTLLFAERTA